MPTRPSPRTPAGKDGADGAKGDKGDTGLPGAGAFGIVRTVAGYAAVSAPTNLNWVYFWRVLEGGTIRTIQVTTGTPVVASNLCVAVYDNIGAGTSAQPNNRKATSGAVACPAANQRRSWCRSGGR